MLKFIGIGVFLLSICIIHLLNRVRDLSNRLDEVDDYITDRIKEEREARYAAYDRAIGTLSQL